MEPRVCPTARQGGWGAWVCHCPLATLSLSLPIRNMAGGLRGPLQGTLWALAPCQALGS